MEWLKSVHFYRKVPRDLTEATLAGGTISLLSSIVMAYLFISNFSAPCHVGSRARTAGQRGPRGWLAEAGRSSGQPEAWPDLERSLRRCRWPEPEPACFRRRRT